jgi:hypothetical protein
MDPLPLRVDNAGGSLSLLVDFERERDVGSVPPPPWSLSNVFEQQELPVCSGVF